MLPCYKASQLYSAWPSSTAIATWNVEFWCRILQPLNGPKPTKKAVIHTLFIHLVSTWNMLPNIKFKDYMQPRIHGSFTWPTGCSQECTQLLRVASGCSKLWLPRVVWVHLPKQIKVFFSCLLFRTSFRTPVFWRFCLLPLRWERWNVLWPLWKGSSALGRKRVWWFEGLRKVMNSWVCGFLWIPKYLFSFLFLSVICSTYVDFWL